MRPSALIALSSFGFGGLAAAVLYKIWPTLHWSIYLVLGLLVTGVVFDELLKLAARQKIIDKDR